jgi:hypothetical protein
MLFVFPEKMTKGQVAIEFMLAVTVLLGIFFLFALVIFDMQRIGVQRYIDNQFDESVQGVRQQLFLVQSQPEGFCTKVGIPKTIAGKSYSFAQQETVDTNEPFLTFDFDSFRSATVKLYDAQGEFVRGDNYVKYVNGSYIVNQEGCEQ